VVPGEAEAMRSKAFLAMLFSVGLIGHAAPAQAQTQEPDQPTVESQIEKLANTPALEPEDRAYLLLNLAIELLKGKNPKTTVGFVSTDGAFKNFRHRSWDKFLVSQRNMAAKDFEPLNLATGAPPSSENIRLANFTLQEAIKNLEQSSNEYAKLSLYFVAARLFRLAANPIESSKYESFVEQSIQACENQTSNFDEQQLKAAAAILNSKAKAIFDISIPDLAYPRTVDDKTLDLTGVKGSEDLRLRSIAIIDKLPATDHDRRMAHRNMALWYTALRWDAQATHQKEILFNLVGIHNDRILFAVKPSSCSSELVWWTANSPVSKVVHLCGMG